MTHSDTNNRGNHKDPVCGVDVSPEKNPPVAVWKDQIFYFCSQSCHDAFEKSPEAYQKKSSFFLKRWWNNYLTRLNKVTKGKPQCCD